MTPLQPSAFVAYFKALWDKKDNPVDPFPWQRRLAPQVCEGQWPSFVDLPTASGKTACLDIAVFALAVQASKLADQRTVGRRIYFAVNRRVIVDEAYQRAVKIAEKLAAALHDDGSDSILRQVAEALKQVSGDTDPEIPPLDVALLRGGIYRDNRWSRSITQPTIITSTIDQLGSRLLFRGYGVSDAGRPMHAALIAHDSTILLDEAHISQPFTQTLEAVREYRGDRWAAEPIRTPFAFVQMTATPGEAAGDVFRIDDEDRKDKVLKARYDAPKPVKLVVAEKAKGKNVAGATAALAETLIEKAGDLLADDRRTVAIVVNRIATARAVHQLLQEKYNDHDEDGAPELHLAIGRMRPVDRDDLTRALQQRVGGKREQSDDTTSMFVVATQCLEVGADFDFDTMVSECASLDALRQRFGRLNRTGRHIQARGCVVIRQDQIKTDDTLDELDKKGESADPIYGNALARTWNLLSSIVTDDTVDFGIAAMEAMLTGVDLVPLLAPRVDAPVMFPAYLDVWAQTAPVPCPDPDVSLFLHGPERGEPDVSVCWRADLTEQPDEDTWTQIVGLCPPSSPECMPVPIGIVRGWLAARPASDEERSDMLVAKTPEGEDPAMEASRTVLAWRGPSKSQLIRKPQEVRPGDTLVLPVWAGGWSVFGHIPDAPPDPATEGGGRSTGINSRVDVAERAYRQSRGRAILRLDSSRIRSWPAGEASEELTKWITDPESDLRISLVRDLIRQVADAIPDAQAADAETLRLLADPKLGLIFNRYARGNGIVLSTRRRIPPGESSARTSLPAMDDGEDEASRVTRLEPIALQQHLQNVHSELEVALQHLPVASLANPLLFAAELHDWGKVDERFQALLLNGDRHDAWAQPTLWAKSARMPMTRAQRRAARVRSGMPEGFRHEMLSVQLAEGSADQLPTEDERDLVLHLIASHHGHARPFAPVVLDDEQQAVSLAQLGLAVQLTAEQRAANPPHRLDSGLAERFWKLTRRFGWWGLAYLETVLRMADQRASAREEREDAADFEPAELEEVVT